MPDLPMKELKALSPSSIDLWLQCPLRFRKEKLEGRRGGSGIDAELGTCIHRALEYLMEQEPEERTAAAAKEGLRIGWTEMMASPDFIALGVPLEDLKALQRRAWASIRGYFEMEDPVKMNVVSTEQKVECELDGVPIRGIIDRVDLDERDRIVVKDYKSGKVPDKRYAGPKLRQLNLYGAMLREIGGTTPTEGQLLFTSFGETIRTRFTDRTLGEAIDTAQEVWAAVEVSRKDGFEPNPGPLCGWCPFAAECPEGIVELKERRKKGRLKKTAPMRYLTDAA